MFLTPHLFPCLLFLRATQVKIAWLTVSFLEGKRADLEVTA